MRRGAPGRTLACRGRPLDSRAWRVSYPSENGAGAMASWKDPEIAGVRALLASRQPAPGAPPPTLDERRTGMDAFGEMGSLPPGCLHEPFSAHGVKCERVVPTGAIGGRQILYLHGGGYVAGSPKSHRPLVARLAEAAKATAVSADYRLG